jgi:hypothetical protein
MERICANCEYFDCGGFHQDWTPRSNNGDYLNNASPRFQTKASDTCTKFYPCSVRWPDEAA